MTNLSNFKNFSGPFPILQAISIQPHDDQAFGVWEPKFNDPIYEWTPFEFGSWDQAFTPVQYIGSMPDANGSASDCVVGLDRAGYVVNLFV